MRIDCANINSGFPCAGFLCQLKDEGQGQLVIDSCPWSQGFEGLQGRNEVAFEEDGFYKIVLNGDAIVQAGDQVALSMQIFVKKHAHKEVFANKF